MARPELPLGTDLGITMGKPAIGAELEEQRELLANLEKQAQLQERIKGLAEGFTETDVVSQKQVDQVENFINAQSRNIEHLHVLLQI